MAGYRKQRRTKAASCLEVRWIYERKNPVRTMKNRMQIMHGPSCRIAVETYLRLILCSTTYAQK